MQRVRANAADTTEGWEKEDGWFIVVVVDDATALLVSATTRSCSDMLGDVTAVVDARSTGEAVVVDDETKVVVLESDVCNCHS